MNKATIAVMILILIIYLCVVIVHQIYTSSIPPAPLLERSNAVPEYVDLMVLFGFLYIAYIIEVLCKTYDVPTPHTGFIIIIAFMWGAYAYYNSVFFLASHIAFMASHEVMFVYVPVIMFNLSFCVDVPIFMKTFPQILMIGVPVTLATATLFGILSTFILDANWSLSIGILLGIFCMPHHPHSVTRILKQQSSRTKQISVLIEGESLIVFFIADISYKIKMSVIEGFILYFYQYVAVVVRVVVMGILCGFLMGKMYCYMIRKMYTNRMSVFIICLGAPFFTYTISELYISGCGSISVMVMGVMLGRERTVLPKDIENFLTDFWDTAAYVMDVVVCSKSAMTAALLVTKHAEWSYYPLSVVTYLTYYMSRFVCFLLFSPIISRLGYGIDLRNMIVCVWAGLKSPYSLEIVSVFIEKNYYVDAAVKFFFFIMGLYFLSVFINGSFTLLMLEFLGLKHISLARQINMNNCIRHIFSKREKTIAILKMDRFLCDTNWPVVVQLTNMQHPYKMGMSNAEDDSLSTGYRFTFCGDCKKEIPQEPTAKEMKELIKEAKMRVLKAKKMSYSRQYENGMMTNEGIRVLSQAVELAIDSEDGEIKIEDLHNRFIEESWFVRAVRRQAESLRKSTELRPPRTYWRRICYHIVVRDKTLDKFMMIVVVSHFAAMIVDIIYNPSLLSMSSLLSHRDTTQYVLTAFKVLFAVAYIAEFIIKIMAYSWIHVCAHGFRTYFKSLWNITDFVIMVTSIVLAICKSIDLARDDAVDLEEFKNSPFRQTLDILRLLRVCRIFGLFEIYYLDIIRCLDKRVDNKMAFTYELGKSYCTGENEILEMLPYMIDNKKIRNEMRRKAESERLLITRLIGLVQKERPWIAITVKTTQAIRTILNSMNESINELKTSGWIDAYENERLLLSMVDLYKKVNSIKRVQPSTPKVIFKEVVWMANDESVINYLFENVTLKKFQPGEVVFGEGNVADGIYIVVTGLFMLQYKPDKVVMNNLLHYGCLPIVDYVSGAKFEEPFTDYIVSGNCIGELSTLTDRPYDCEIKADVYSQVYVLNRYVINRAKEMSADSVTGLECRIWKAVAVRVAVPILLSVPTYQAFSQDVIKYALERAFVPDLKRFKIFVVTNMVDDVILIEGVVADFNTRQIFTAPCYIPRTVQKIILSASSLMKLPKAVKTKLLIIPAKDVDEYDVMTEAEETCEMVETGSATKCLQHTVQDRARNKKMARRAARAGLRTHGSRIGSVPSMRSSMTNKPAAMTSNISDASAMSSSQKSGISEFLQDSDEEETSNVAYQEPLEPIPEVKK